jgi:hypothetical protein
VLKDDSFWETKVNKIEVHKLNIPGYWSTKHREQSVSDPFSLYLDYCYSTSERCLRRNRRENWRCDRQTLKIYPSKSYTSSHSQWRIQWKIKIKICQLWIQISHWILCESPQRCRFVNQRVIQIRTFQLVIWWSERFVSWKVIRCWSKTNVGFNYWGSWTAIHEALSQALKEQIQLFSPIKFSSYFCQFISLDIHNLNIQSWSAINQSKCQIGSNCGCQNVGDQQTVSVPEIPQSTISTELAALSQKSIITLQNPWKPRRFSQMIGNYQCDNVDHHMSRFLNVQVSKLSRDLKIQTSFQRPFAGFSGRGDWKRFNRWSEIISPIPNVDRNLVSAGRSRISGQSLLKTFMPYRLSTTFRSESWEKDVNVWEIAVRWPALTFERRWQMTIKTIKIWKRQTTDRTDNDF